MKRAPLIQALARLHGALRKNEEASAAATQDHELTQAHIAWLSYRSSISTLCGLLDKYLEPSLGKVTIHKSDIAAIHEETNLVLGLKLSGTKSGKEMVMTVTPTFEQAYLIHIEVEGQALQISQDIVGQLNRALSAQVIYSPTPRWAFSSWFMNVLKRHGYVVNCDMVATEPSRPRYMAYHPKIRNSAMVIQAESSPLTFVAVDLQGKYIGSDHHTVIRHIEETVNAGETML